MNNKSWQNKDFINQIDLLMLNNQNREAYELLKEDMPNSFRNGNVLHRFGVVAFRAGDYKAAEGAFGYMAAQPGAKAITHHSLGQTLEMLGKISDAEKSYENTLQIDPNHRQAREALNRLRAMGKRTSTHPSSENREPQQSTPPRSVREPQQSTPPRSVREPQQSTPPRSVREPQQSTPPRSVREPQQSTPPPSTASGLGDFEAFPGFNVPRTKKHLDDYMKSYIDFERAKSKAGIWQTKSNLERAGIVFMVILGIVIFTMVIIIAIVVIAFFLGYDLLPSAVVPGAPDWWCQQLRESGRFGDNLPAECSS